MARKLLTLVMLAVTLGALGCFPFPVPYPYYPYHHHHHYHDYDHHR